MSGAKRKRRNSKRRRKSDRRAFIIKLLLLLLIVPIIAVAAFLTHYYYVFDGNIEMKLGRKRPPETKIYSAPTVLYPGRPVTLPQLESSIRKLGYREAQGRMKGARYRVLAPNRLLICNDEAPPRKADIIFSGNTIHSIEDPDSGRELTRFALKPEVLSNAIDKNREKRRPVSFHEIPEHLVNAVLAVEDRRFFSHSGIDPLRIIKALIVDLREGETVQGASTLTQQFVKNYFLTPERTWRRKFADAYMSILLENRLSKKEIFELYSNEVYLGQIGTFSIVGFGEAADAFFGKNIRDLSLGEAATLAGIITAPNRLTPLRYSDKAALRRDRVLDAMADYRMITPSERDRAKSQPLLVRHTSILNYSDAPYFVDYVQEQLIRRHGDGALARSEYSIYTTLDPDLQQAAYESIQSGMKAVDAEVGRTGKAQVALIAVDPRNGHILAMVGGRNYGNSQFNRITQARRQPGSIFKPFVYAAALETAYSGGTRLTTASTVIDQPTRFTDGTRGYTPRNFKDVYYGQVTMRQAITKSLNVATIKFAEKAGFERVVALARRLGLNENIKPYPAMAIGSFETTPFEMAQAYTAFANEGRLSELTPIVKIRDRNGRQVFTTKSAHRQVLTPQVAFVVTSLLQSVMDHGTGSSARSRGFLLPAAGKTGTSRDGWFAGYTPDLLCIVWVGFDDNRELGLSGSESALPIWTEFMKRASRLQPLSKRNFTVPKGVRAVEIDPETGLPATKNSSRIETHYFIEGTEPTATATAPVLP